MVALCCNTISNYAKLDIRKLCSQKLKNEQKRYWIWSEKNQRPIINRTCRHKARREDDNHCGIYTRFFSRDKASLARVKLFFPRKTLNASWYVAEITNAKSVAIARLYTVIATRLLIIPPFSCWLSPFQTKLFAQLAPGKYHLRMQLPSSGHWSQRIIISFHFLVHFLKQRISNLFPFQNKLEPINSVQKDPRVFSFQQTRNSFKST